MTKLTHLDGRGNARMVDIGGKTVTERTATARGSVKMSEQTLAIIRKGETQKGDVLGIARLAGIMAAKKTPEIIPLCHPLPLTGIAVDLTPTPPDRIEIEATVKLSGRTGAEMEALTAVSAAALTVYDMVKAVDKSMRITDIRLIRKEGGKSGLYQVE